MNCPPLQHVKGDAEENEAPGDLEGGQADAEVLEGPAAHKHEQGQDEEGIDAGPARQGPGRGRRGPGGQGQVGKDVGQRVDYHEQGHQAGDKKGLAGSHEIRKHGLKLRLCGNPGHRRKKWLWGPLSPSLTSKTSYYLRNEVLIYLIPQSCQSILKGQVSERLIKPLPSSSLLSPQILWLWPSYCAAPNTLCTREDIFSDQEHIS